MERAPSGWLKPRLALAAAVVAMLCALALFSPEEVRVKVLLASLMLTLGSLIAAALKGGSATYRAAAFCASGTVLLLTAGSFAATGNLPHLSLAVAGAVGIVLSSRPRWEKAGQPPAGATAP